MKKCLVGVLAAVVAAGCVSLYHSGSWRDYESPLIISHRGSRGEYEDNAAEGFAKCLKNGIRGFETDIRITKDDELVIMHDSNVARTTTGSGDVHNMTLAEITSLTLKRSGDHVPSLAKLLSVFKGRSDVRLELEMKESTEKLGKERGELYCRKLHDQAVAAMKPGTYIFTSFNEDTLRTMKALFPDAPIGLIRGKPCTREYVDTAIALGCEGIAPILAGTTSEAMDYAHEKGLLVTLWMVQNYRDYAASLALKADFNTSDWPMKLKKSISRKKKLVCLDLDATLCEHRMPPPPENFAALNRLEKQYKCVMVAAGNAQRVYKQMGNYPIDIVANYGMQETKVINGKFTVVKAVTNTVDRAFFREKTDYLRKKYGYTEYFGEPLEFHPSGMVTFGLLGTTPPQEKKLAFDPDRKKRRAMYKEVCEIFKDYSVFIGGSTSFDFAGKQYNKYDAALDYARRHGYKEDEVVFIGDDFGDGGGDSHVRIKGMDYIEITDYRKFPEAVSILLNQ